MNTYKDDYYRSLCEFPTQYDKVIDWIVANNPHAAACTEGKDSRYKSAEEFACEVVHSCIRQQCFGDTGAFASTGMALAVKSPTATRISGCPKVVLAIML